MKFNFKFLITSFVLFLLFFSTFCFATDTNNEIMLISETEHFVQTQTVNTLDSDLYIADESEYEIKDIINGNVFATVDTLNINPYNNGGIIQGNLFVTADNVNIKSDVTYSDTKKDELGNNSITINKSSTILGNVFVLTDKFVLEPGCKIDGDLYICANEIDLQQKSKVNGNIFICANTFYLNGEVGGNLYANVETFDMKYYGFVFRDLNLNAQNVNLNGYIYRNSFITAKNITTENNFINEKDFTIINSENLIFSGNVLGNASINSKNISFKTKENDTNLVCKINGNLSYSSNQEIEIPEGIVLKEVNYSSYNNTTAKNAFSSILDYILKIIGLLICAHIIYVLIHKFVPNYLDKLSNFSVSNLLKYLGIGLGFVLLTPIIIILLLISRIGTILGFILLFIYIVLLIISKPIFIIYTSNFAKNKIPSKINIYVYMLLIDVILSLISLIPYIGFIISILVSFAGFGIVMKNFLLSKK